MTMLIPLAYPFPFWHYPHPTPSPPLFLSVLGDSVNSTSTLPLDFVLEGSF